MTIQEIMERSGMVETTLTVAWLKDAYNLLQSNTDEKMKVAKFDIIDGERDYVLPTDMVALKNVSIKDTSDDTYKRIPRLARKPIVTEDLSPE